MILCFFTIQLPCCFLIITHYFVKQIKLFGQDAVMRIKGKKKNITDWPTNRHWWKLVWGKEMQFTLQHHDLESREIWTRRRQDNKLLKFMTLGTFKQVSLQVRNRSLFYLFFHNPVTQNMVQWPDVNSRYLKMYMVGQCFNSS